MKEKLVSMHLQIISPINFSRLKATLFAGSVLFGLLTGTADVAAQEGPKPTDGGAEAVVETSRLKQSPPTASVSRDANSIKNDLSEKLKEGGIKQGWDDKKQRFGGIQVYKFRQGEKVNLEDYFAFRQLASLGAMLTAQSSLAQWLGAEASMDVCLNDPGNPQTSAGGPYAQAKKELEVRIAALRKQAEIVGAKASGDLNLTSSDRWKILTDVIIKKIDSSYDPKKSAEEKKQKIAEFKQEFESIRSSIGELEQKLLEYQRAYSKSLKAGMPITYDHVIFGLSSVAWGENLSPDGTLTVGLAFVWSPKLAKSAHAALTGDPTLDTDNVKGTESIDQWIEKQDLSSIGAFRYFIDDQGDRWFIGTGFCPNSLDRSDQVARFQATMNLYMPLYSRLKGMQYNSTEARGGTRATDLPARVVYDLKEQLQSFSRQNTRGSQSKLNKDVDWPAQIVKTGDASSASIAVQVYALDAKSAAAALSAIVQQAMAAAAVEHENNRRRLEQAQLLGIVDKAKTETPDSRVPGLTGKKTPNSSKTDPIASPTPSSTNSAVNLSPLPGKKVTPGKVKDDF